MKLVEILARELKEWPCDGPATQDPDKEVRFLNPGYDFYAKQLAEDARLDHGEGREVTKQELQDERARLQEEANMLAEHQNRARVAKPTKKADKDGWIRHRGGKCPVDGDTVVDIRCRNGRVHEGEPAYQFIWKHSNDIGDAMAYRIHRPAEQPVIERDYEKEAQQADAVILVDTDIGFPSGVIHADGPIQWRDRITEIDRTIEALEEERVSLIQRLADEGFKLIDKINEGIEDAKQAHEDMTDWRNWKKGDLFTVIGGDDHYFEVGDIVALSKNDGTIRLLFSKNGIENWIDTDCVKFHSRPSA